MVVVLRILFLGAYLALLYLCCGSSTNYGFSWFRGLKAININQLQLIVPQAPTAVANCSGSGGGCKARMPSVTNTLKETKVTTAAHHKTSGQKHYSQVQMCFPNKMKLKVCPEKETESTLKIHSPGTKLEAPRHLFLTFQ